MPRSDGKTLVCGHRDSAGLVWDVAGASRQARASAKELTAGELERLWTDLASEDAAKANAAAWFLKSSEIVFSAESFEALQFR